MHRRAALPDDSRISARGFDFGLLIYVAASHLITRRVVTFMLYLSIEGLALCAFVTRVRRTVVFWHSDQVLRRAD